MSMTSREQFEQAIKARFGDSVDYRVCKNSDGEYMAWDMQVAWWAWQAAFKESEQQLSESRREFTAANATIHNLELKVERVVAENAGLKKFCKNAAFDADYEAELCMERGGFTDALNDIKTPATDAYLAEVRAQGVEMFSRKFGGGTPLSNLVKEVAADLTAQLRQGAAK